MTDHLKNTNAKPLDELLPGEDEKVLDKRRFERLDIVSTVGFIPLRDDGPVYDRQRTAETRNISKGGVALVVTEPPLEPRWAVRLDLGKHSALLEIAVRHLHRKEDGKYYLSCQFLRRIDEHATVT